MQNTSRTSMEPTIELQERIIEHEGHQYIVIDSFPEQTWAFRVCEHGHIEFLTRFCDATTLNKVHEKIIDKVLSLRKVISPDQELNKEDLLAITQSLEVSAYHLFMKGMEEEARKRLKVSSRVDRIRQHLLKTEKPA